MPRKLTDQERRWRAISERDHQADIWSIATMYGWRCCHFSDSRKQVRPGVFVGDKDSAGFPDLTMVHARHGVAFIEAKRELGKVSDAQHEWLDALQAAGVPAFVSRPSRFEDVRGWLMRGFPGPEVLASLR